MPSQQYKLIAQVEGEQKIRLLNEQLKATKQLWDQAAASGNASKAALDNYAASAARLSSALQKAQTEQKNLSSAAGLSSHKIMQLAQTLDDAKQFAYGFDQGMRAIGNNIVQISPAVGIALIAVQVLAKAFMSFADSAGQVKSVREELEALEKQTNKTADAERRYQDLKKGEKTSKKIEGTADRLSEERPEANEIAAKRVQAAIKGQGSDAQSGFDKLTEVLGRDKGLLQGLITAEDQNRLKELKQKQAEGQTGELSMPGSEFFGKPIEEIIRMTQEAALERAKQALANHLANPATFGSAGNIKQLRDQVESHRKELGGQGFDVNGFLASLDQAMPANVQKEQQQKVIDAARKVGKDFVEKFAEGLSKAAKEEVDRQKKVRKAADDAIDAENQQLDDKNKKYVEFKKRSVAESKQQLGVIEPDFDKAVGERNFRGKSRESLIKEYTQKLMEQSKADGKNLPENFARIAATSKVDEAIKRRADQEKDKILSGRDLGRRAPGLDDDLAGRLAAREANGQSAQKAIRAVTDELDKQLKKIYPDLTDEERKNLAAKQVEMSQDKVTQGVSEAQQQQKEQEQKKSETVGLAEFAAKIQSGVGLGNSNYPKTQAEYLKKIYEVLAQQGNVPIRAILG